MKGRHREIQDRIINFLASRLELQTPAEISTADHRELCMQQLTALVREAGIRPLQSVIEDPSVYFAILEAAGSIYISFGIKLAGQYRESCGGHGYAAVNHFGILHNNHDIFQTFEGANAVLSQQVAGELLKQYKSILWRDSYCDMELP